MELTVTFCCPKDDCPSGSEQEQTETVKIRRGQRIQIQCGFCEEVAVEIQANRKPR